MYFEGKGQLKEANEVYSRFQSEFPDHELLEKRKVRICPGCASYAGTPSLVGGW